jgi:hypothetical protein
VDRLPLVSSAIINVAQDVDDPWPLEVIGHDGKAVNVTMMPGDMVMYESHSVLHGLPFPLKAALWRIFIVRINDCLPDYLFCYSNIIIPPVVPYTNPRISPTFYC